MKIKMLVWEHIHSNVYHANTIIGKYALWYSDTYVCFMFPGDTAGRLLNLLNGGTKEQGMEYCQNHFEEVISEVLEN